MTASSRIFAASEEKLVLDDNGLLFKSDSGSLFGDGDISYVNNDNKRDVSPKYIPPKYPQHFEVAREDSMDYMQLPSEPKSTSILAKQGFFNRLMSCLPSCVTAPEPDTSIELKS